jgi:hypothetical protein
MSSICDLALKETSARASEYEIITRIRQKVSGKDIAKPVREDRKARWIKPSRTCSSNILRLLNGEQGFKTK